MFDLCNCLVQGCLSFQHVLDNSKMSQVLTKYFFSVIFVFMLKGRIRNINSNYIYVFIPKMILLSLLLVMHLLYLSVDMLSKIILYGYEINVLRVTY